MSVVGTGSSAQALKPLNPQFNHTGDGAFTLHRGKKKNTNGVQNRSTVNASKGFILHIPNCKMYKHNAHPLGFKKKL
jgi:3-hydroxy-3-methylglutaryl CoA synthase